MRRMLITIVLAVTAILPAAADEFDDALAAYRGGDFETALQRLEPLADGGDPRAEFALGRMYHLGQGVERSDSKAIFWFKRAADDGLVDARYYLGVMYATGRGAETDHAQAVRWFRAAAEQGDPRSQFGLGTLLLRSETLESSEDGVAWIKKSAAQGFADAQFVLGGLFAAGDGVEQDCVAGATWNGLAAAQGHERALAALERCSDHMTDEQKAEVNRRIESFQAGGD